MVQGDPKAIDQRVRENGTWHDGACFIWDEQAKRMTGAFLAFQTQAWHTNDNGDVIYGATGSRRRSMIFPMASARRCRCRSARRNSPRCIARPTEPARWSSPI